MPTVERFYLEVEAAEGSGEFALNGQLLKSDERLIAVLYMTGVSPSEWLRVLDTMLGLGFGVLANDRGVWWFGKRHV
jgi:hypothetical protein